MRIARTAVALAAVASAVLLAPTAPAAAAVSDCPETYVCIWENHHYSGRMGRFAGNETNLKNRKTPATNCPGSWNDCASSVYNNGLSGCAVFLFVDAGYKGKYHTLARGDAENIPDWDPGFNDKLSSIRWCSPG